MLQAYLSLVILRRPRCVIHGGLFYMKKILVTGANGLFGEACCRIFQESSGYDVIPMTRADADLADLVSLREYLGLERERVAFILLPS